MICSNCGAENASDSRFCNSCGAGLVEDTSAEETVISDKIVLADLIINDRFRILRKLGKGGMGEVFLAEDVKLKRKVAVKRIFTNTMNDDSTKARFLREAQTASQLDHPNICTIYEIYEEEDYDYIVMQFVDGVSLDEVITVKPLSLNKMLDLAGQVCTGMIEAHSEGIIHRDIKPGNVMIDRKGVVKILDFGLAKFGDDAASKKNDDIDANLTEKGMVLGTVSYLSPEQAAGKAVDLQSDIFSFGVLMYEMLEGKNPFKEDEQISTLYNVLNKNVTFHRDIPEALEVIIRKTLEKNKKDRYISFVQLKKDLEAFRAAYDLIKDQPGEGGEGTETIGRREHQRMMREIRSGSSSGEGLGELVHRIKKFNAATERVSTVGRKRRSRLIAVVIVLLLAAAGYFAATRWLNRGGLAVKNPTEKFYVFLHPFDNNTRDKNLQEHLNYLLTESLNQFQEFKVIDREEAASILEKPEKGVIDPGELSGRFKINYELKGKISFANGFYTIDAVLSPRDKKKKEKRLTITGQGKDSFLVDQVDNLTKRVYGTFYPRANFQDFAFKKVSGIFGADWKAFSDFYRGYSFKNQMEMNKAKQYLSKAKSLLISKYYLADAYYFEGSRLEASSLVRDVTSELNSLTQPLKYRVLALTARLAFDFEREILNLEKLRKDFRFSKEVFLESGNAYFHHGDATRALGYYQKALELNSNFSKALNRMGYCYSYLGDHVKAIEAFEEYRRLDQSVNSFDSLGDGYFYAGEYNSSLSMKSLAVSTGEQSAPWAYLTLADIHILRARYKDARSALNKYTTVQRAKDDRAEALDKQAYIHYVNRDYTTALEIINRSLALFDSDDINSESAEAHWLKGLILLALDNPEDSQLEQDWLDLFCEKYKLSRENFKAPYKYSVHLEALLLEKTGDSEAAEGKFKFLVEMKPRLSYWTTYYHYQFFHCEYVAFLMRGGKYEEALREIDTCLAYNRNYIPALWFKAAVLEELNDLQRFAVYKKIAELYGQSTEQNYLRKLLKQKIK